LEAVKDPDDGMVASVERGAEGRQLLLGALDLSDRRYFTGLEICLEDHCTRGTEFDYLLEKDREDVFGALGLKKAQGGRNVLADAA
jgi:hypothetical protein